MDAAVELWSSTGYRGTGITDGSRSWRESKPAGLLHHFGTKDHFLLAVVEELSRRTLEVYDTSPWCGAPRAVSDLLPHLARYPSERPALWRLLLMLQAENFDAESPAYDYFMTRQAFVIHELIADALRRGQADQASCTATSTRAWWRPSAWPSCWGCRYTRARAPQRRPRGGPATYVAERLPSPTSQSKRGGTRPAPSVGRAPGRFFFFFFFFFFKKKKKKIAPIRFPSCWRQPGPGTSGRWSG